MSTIEINEQFSLERGGRKETSWMLNHCKKCGWSGQKHYAYNDYQHSNCKEERAEHKCKSSGNSDLLLRWIPVGERLPKTGVEVQGVLLGCSGKRVIRPITKVNATDHDWESEGFEIANCWDITHWAEIPLPAP